MKIWQKLTLIGAQVGPERFLSAGKRALEASFKLWDAAAGSQANSKFV